MRATWHFIDDLARLTSDGVELLTLQCTEAGGHAAIFENRQWTVVDHGFWEPGTVLFRDAREHARMARTLGMPHPVLTVLDGGRYSFKLVQGDKPKLSLINSMGREVMVQRTMDPGITAIELRISRERVPRADLSALIILAGHVFHGLYRERRSELSEVRQPNPNTGGPQIGLSNT